MEEDRRLLSHILAAAIKHVFTDALLGAGDTTDDGFRVRREPLRIREATGGARREGSSAARATSGQGPSLPACRLSR